MKNLITILTGIFLTGLSLTMSAQQTAGDSTAVIRVSGECGMCKDRIEEAAKGKGVHSATWDENNRLLTLVYDPALTNPRKVERRIADVGHDTEHEKARDEVYEALPDCCHYRANAEDKAKVEHGEAKKNDSTATIVDSFIRGVVLEENTKGVLNPLVGATVQWLGSSSGTVTDTAGVFSIHPLPGISRLVISYTGYTPDTISAPAGSDVKIILATGKQLHEVKVTGRQRSTYLSSLTPIRTQVMTERELFKAACCNLSESFETNPAVDVSFNDAVTGSKQIQLLGLSGNYTQLTVESMPGPRGLATPQGLNFIPGPWVESIQLSKGVGSVANGFESIAGQINIEMKKPETAEKLYANAYINNMGKTDLNLLLTQKLGKNWSTALLLHDNFMSKSDVDFNKDGFRDMTTGNLFTALNRWKFENGKGWESQFGWKVLLNDLTGGETSFDPDKDRLGTDRYGLGINIKRYEAFGKIGYVFPEKRYKSVGLQLSFYNHRQDSYFGQTVYDARQKNVYANLIYQSIIGSSIHKFRTGASLLSDNYNELFNSTRYRRSEVVPGGFFEYTFTPVDKFNLVAGIRADHNSLFGWFATPRLHIRYEPVKGTTIRLSAGRGQRTANIFAENNSVMVSSRQLQILTNASGKAYGLNPEVAWNKGISVDQKFRLFNRTAGLALDFYRNDFSDQVILDLEDARVAKFYNLDGKSYSNSFQAELSFEPVRKLETRIAYRFFDVKATYGSQLLQRPFTARHRAFANLAYELSGWKFDYTINYNGQKRVPSTAANPPALQRQVSSPSYVLMNAQVTKTLGDKHPVDLYLGGENLTNFLQRDAILSPNEPFGPYFDASLVWGPVGGRLVYFGIRYKIK
ncbi:MAG: TonB-dependent receptor domain-containing protein [Chitinophagaceae bacterium]